MNKKNDVHILVWRKKQKQINIQFLNKELEKEIGHKIKRQSL